MIVTLGTSPCIVNQFDRTAKKMCSIIHIYERNAELNKIISTILNIRAG